MPKRKIWLQGSPHVIHQLPALLSGPTFTVTRVDDQTCVLESERLGELPDLGVAFDAALDQVRDIAALLRIYTSPHWEGDLRVLRAQEIREDGAVRNLAKSNFFKVGILAAPETAPWTTRSGRGETTFIEIHYWSKSDPDAARVLPFVRTEAPGWRDLYDLVEAIGGRDRVVEKGWTTRRAIEDIMQVANYHRHLGKPLKEPLPDPPPTLEDARVTVLRLVRQWLEERRALAGRTS